MIRVLCFGDSNTWGCIPGTTFERFPPAVRFTKVLQSMLGRGFTVIEDGVNSRTLSSVYQRPGKEGTDGSASFIPCVVSNEPLDLIVLMLGTTELKKEFNNSPDDIGRRLEESYVKALAKIRHSNKPLLLIVSPPVINEKRAHKFYAGGESKSKQLSRVYAEIAERNGCQFIDASGLDVGSDGVHMTREGHLKLADMLYERIKSLNL